MDPTTETTTEAVNTVITSEFRRLLDWHCDMLRRHRPRRPTIGELLEERLRPILEKESKPPGDYPGHKKHSRKREPGKAKPQSIKSTSAA
jgi:hypothetical protein